MTASLKYKNFIGLFIIAVACISSCSSSKRAGIATVTNTAKSMVLTETAMLGNMENKKDKIAAEEKIDSILNAKINAKLKDYADELNTTDNAVKFIEAAIKSGKLFRKNKKEVEIKLKLIDNYTSDTALRLKRFAMIGDGLNIAQQYLFNLGAYFGAGQYDIPADKLEQAQQSFAIILDSLSNFYNRYTDIDRVATVTILGFADASGYNKEGDTYTTLVKLLNDSVPTREMINQKISELRAKTMSNIMEVILSKKIPNYSAISKLDFIFLEIGKGEALPSKKITDYAVDDERRRVVLIFWNILPK
jgi:hypothetical protein